ncbi:MAG TPA: sensor domain-containing diguanylate cyclase [Solirubrobacteraceae bacterium]|jgi:diguanylate cyclase (GGDEF)-like protein|nr:sensor domain-containing diguanylate cyclase [Solirubrobacteraceae bacterium]
MRTTTRTRPSPPVASSARLDAEVQRPTRLAALVAEGLLDGSPEPVFDRFARVAAQAAGTPVALVSLVTDARQCFVGMCGVKQPWADARETPLTHSFCQHVVANAAPLVVEDARLDPILCSNLAVIELDVVAYAGYPIVGPGGAVLGSLCAIDDRPRVWRAAQLESLSEIALLLGNELERRSLVRRLAADARTDALTGLANRRAWDEELPRALHHAQRLGHPLTAVIVDVDHFKAYNDRHGHPAGDTALRDLGARWSTHVRDIDVLARIGGEEFGLLLPGASARETLHVADRLRHDMPGGLTASVGIAVWTPPMTADALVALADGALYRAKVEGRDRACIAVAR